MPYDDDEYWPKPIAEAKGTPVAPRSPPWSTEATPKPPKAYRGEKPSPLLVEWFRVRGIDVK